MGKIAQRLSLEDIIRVHVPRNGILGLGGLHFHNTPMAMIRELIRQQIEIAVLIPPLDGSINADQLIGAELVKEVQIAYLGAERFGLAGRFRAAAESGSLRVRDCEEAGFALAVAAGAAGLPFAALPGDFLPEPQATPTIRSVNAIDYRPVRDPFTGREQIVVKAIAPDVSLIHCQFVDRRGTGGFLGGTFLDIEMAKAAKVCLVQAEFEVDELPAGCRGNLPGYVVDAYCVLEGGAHPASSHGVYAYDEEHIRSYLAASRSQEGYRAYREHMIGPTEAAYRQAASVRARILELRTTAP